MGFECVMSRIRSAMEGDVYNARLAVRGVSNLATTSAHPDWAVSSVVEHCLHTRSFQVARLFPHHIFALTFSGCNCYRLASVLRRLAGFTLGH